MRLSKEFALGVVCLAVFGLSVYTTVLKGVGGYTATGAMVGVLALFWLGGGVTGHGSL